MSGASGVDGTGDGGGDGTDGPVDTTPVAAGTYGGNTGGGNVGSSNGLRQLLPGIFEIPIMIDGADSVEGATLVEATRDVRKEAEDAIAKATLDEAKINSELPNARDAVGRADRAQTAAQARLDKRKAEFEITRGLVAKIGVAGFVSHMTSADPEVLLLAGETERSMVIRSYSATAATSALEGHERSQSALAEALAASKKSRLDADAAKANVERLDGDLAKTRSIKTKAQQILYAMLFEPTAASTTAPATNPLAALAGGPDLAVANLLRLNGPTTFPIAGKWDFIDSWGFPRSGGRTHKGADIFSPKGTPVVAIEDSIVKSGSNSLGGQVLYVFGRSGNRYYYAHLSAFVPNIDGAQVKAGQVIGYVGNTGNAISTPDHLHFEVRVPQLLADINPYPMLKTLSTAVDGARLRGATALVPASALPLMTVDAARREWNANKVSMSSLSYLDAATIVGLINSGRVTATALGASPPSVYAQAKPKILAQFSALVPASPGPELPLPLPPVVMPLSMKPGTKSASTTGITSTAGTSAASTSGSAISSGTSGSPGTSGASGSS